MDITKFKTRMRLKSRRQTSQIATLPDVVSDLEAISAELNTAVKVTNSAQVDASGRAGVVNPSAGDGASFLGVGVRAYNLTTYNTAGFRAMVAKARAGLPQALAINGDSTTAGQGTGSDGVMAGARSKCVTVQLAKQLAALGVPASYDSFFGDQRQETAAAYVAYNPAVSAGAGWSTQLLLGLGGRTWANSTDTSALAFTPDAAFDTIDVFYIAANGNATLTVDIGGEALATINTNQAATAWLKATVSTGGAPATGVINIKRNGTGALARVCGVVARNSVTGGIAIYNASWVGAKSADMADATGVYSPAPALAATGANGFIVNLGLNDITAGVAVDTYIGNLTSIINRLKAAAPGAVAACVPTPQDPVTRDTFGLTPAYVTALLKMSKDLDVPLLFPGDDMWDWTTGTANGLFQDAVHGKTAFYAMVAESYRKLLMR